MGASITSLGRKKSLSSLLQYVANPSKKEKCVAVSGINCSEELQKTLQQMNRTRTKLNHSKDITQAYHLVHSFDRDTSKKLNKEVMHAIAVEFAEKSFPNCQVFVASHNDKKHSQVFKNIWVCIFNDNYCNCNCSFRNCIFN